MADSASSLIGQTVSHYRILEKLGAQANAVNSTDLVWSRLVRDITGILARR